jgi:murein DD-endopeptidase MepM/ murein hydrolase activator NlpD
MQVTKLKFSGVPSLLLLAFTVSCNSAVKLWGKKTAHEIYADKIEKSPAGQQWITISKKTLEAPHSVQLPYSHFGYFPPGQPRALTLEFTATQGEKIIVDLKKNGQESVVLYADLFEREGPEISHIESTDTALTQISLDVDETSTYLLRLQPRLYQATQYNLTISVAPTLDFPVAGTKAKAGSFWGDDRDAGKRKHEGIDIFAAKLTPAVAAADGYVTGVNEGGLGGKTIWMRVVDKNIHLYYAHLDRQLVEQGQRVKKGDTLGLVGNTGNARFTAPHLHFGIYNYNGAIDPWPFVNKSLKHASPVKPKDLDMYLEIRKATTKKTDAIDNEVLVPLAATDHSYIAETTGGKIITVPFKSATQVKSHTRAILASDQSKIVTVDPGTNSNN